MEYTLNESRRTYMSKINTVQDYIENHLDETLTVAQLAAVASFSEFHFQRIFKLMIGESLYGFIKRLRLEKAVFYLRSNPKMAIQDIAFAVGFSSQSALAKAIKERFGMHASEMRQLNDENFCALMYQLSTNGKVSNQDLRYTSPSELTIKTIAPTKVVYVRHTGAYKGNAQLFMSLFTKLYGYASKQQLITAQTKWFTVYHDFGDLTQEEKLRLSVCLSVEKDHTCHGEFGSMDIAGGKYAIGRFSLKTSDYQAAWNYMISKWLPESGYVPDDRLCFEYYPPQDCDTENTDHTDHTDHTERLVEIYIPITPL